MTFGKIGRNLLFRKRTARDYVQNGLVAMWDGIENVGWGTHDGNATVWKDLMGNYDASFSMGHQGSGINPNGKWNSDSYEFPDNGVSTASFTANLGDILTFQFAFSNRREVSKYWAFYDTFDDSVAFWYSSNDRAWQNRIYGKVSALAIDNNLLGTNGTITHSFGNGLARLKYNNVFDYEATINYGSAVSKKWGIGGPYVTNYFTGKMHNVRIYSRMLTSEEIAHNYAIDKIRFNLQ